MIAFATLFLGLVMGIQVVEVAVDGPVDTVVLYLDGERIGLRAEPPWRFQMDLGHAYEPHVLEAVTFDAEGAEIDRAEQWLNVPRRVAEAEVVLSGGGDADGEGVVARVLWESRVPAAPEVSASFDGRPIHVLDPERIVLPPHDPEILHLLQVELRFPGNYSTTVEKTFGGSYTDEVETLLTAVPIDIGRSSRAPTPGQLAGRFTGRDGKPLHVVAVDEGAADLLIVRALGVQPILDRLVTERTVTGRMPRPGRATAPTPQLRFVGRLKKNQRVRMLYPTAREAIGKRLRQEQFPTSHEYTSTDGSLAWILVRERWPAEMGALEEQRLAEAVAVAGMAAAERNRRRVVLLLVSEDAPDVSKISPAEARQYLSSLSVPLVVWSLGASEEGEWGAGRRVGNMGALQTAAKEVTKLVDRQRIVWLRGRHRPQDIWLRDSGDISLVR